MRLGQAERDEEEGGKEPLFELTLQPPQQATTTETMTRALTAPTIPTTVVCVWGEGGKRPSEHNKLQTVYTKRKEAGPPPSHRQAGSDGISMSYSRTGWERIRLGEALHARLIFRWASGKTLLTNRWWFSDDKNLRSYNIYISFYQILINTSVNMNK